MEDTRPKEWAVWFKAVMDDAVYHLFTGTFQEAINWTITCFWVRLQQELDVKTGCPDCAEHCRTALAILYDCKKYEDEMVIDDELQVEGDSFYILPVPPLKEKSNAP